VKEHIRSETTIHEEGDRRNRKLFGLFSKSRSSIKGGKKKLGVGNRGYFCEAICKIMFVVR
jgi:hypothetical protein